MQAEQCGKGRVVYLEQTYQAGRHKLFQNSIDWAVLDWVGQGITRAGQSMDSSI